MHFIEFVRFFSVIASALAADPSESQVSSDTVADANDISFLQASLDFQNTADMLRTAPAISMAGWYAGGEGESCDSSCASRGLVCTNNDHNAEIDTADEVKSLIAQVGGETDDDFCTVVKTGCDYQPGSWKAKGTCWYCTSPTISDCGASNEKRHRLCYCDQTMMTTTTTTAEQAIPTTTTEQASNAHVVVSGSYEGSKTGHSGGFTKSKVENCMSDGTTEVDNPDPSGATTAASLAMGTVCCDPSGKGTRPDCKTGTFADAEKHCNDNGKTLCSLEQLKNGAGEASGCHFDGKLVWSSDTCQATTTAEQACSMGDPISGRSPGSSMGQTTKQSLEECQDFCLEDDSCLAITYRADSGACWRLDRSYDGKYEEASDDCVVANKACVD